MDKDTPATEATMKKTFQSKIVVTGEPSTYSPVEQGIKTLSDAMLANEYQTTVEIAIQKIKEKNTPNFSGTAPITTWAQHTGSNTTVNADKPHPDINGSYGLTAYDCQVGIKCDYQKIILGKSYNFNSENGFYTLGDIVTVDPTTIEDYIGTNYYFCGSSTTIDAQSKDVNTVNNYQNCGTIYKVSSVSETTFGNPGTNEYRVRYEVKGTVLNQVELESDKSDKGLYVTEDDLGESYYYRGSVKNNFVKLGTGIWRIIRRNGDGTVRVIYNGESTEQKNTVSSNQFNDKVNDPAYVGYMYGNELNVSKDKTQANDNPSTMKTYLEQWYTENIENKNLDNIIVDGIFCNDRSTTENGFTTNVTINYGSYNRLAANKNPDLKCNQEGDRFTVESQVSTVTGNKKNNKPIGLITADEVSIAGAVNGYYNRLFWLYTGQTYWTMSPSLFNSNNTASSIWSLYSDGAFYVGRWVDSAGGVRPVINISSTAEITKGTGTASDPFVIRIN